MGGNADSEAAPLTAMAPEDHDSEEKTPEAEEDHALVTVPMNKAIVSTSPGKVAASKKSRKRGRDQELLAAVSRRSETCIDDYEVFRAVGKGKFSTVYRAELEATGETFALKRVSVFSNMNTKSRIKCLEEIDLIKALDHNNIIRCQDAFLDKDELVIVLEWANAGDLKRQIRKARERERRFEERIIWKYFVQLVGAIEHMHKKRIMHRDLKPANIFLMTDGCVKVGDLGLGRALNDKTLAAFSKVGTPLYMSPEVLLGKGYDWKSDVWSLGCILYELAALRSPFKEENIALPELFRKIEVGKYPSLDDHYSAELGMLADAMLSVDPELRPSVGEVYARARAVQVSLGMRPPTIATQRTSPGAARRGSHARRDEESPAQQKKEDSRSAPISARSSASSPSQPSATARSKLRRPGSDKTLESRSKTAKTTSGSETAQQQHTQQQEEEQQQQHTQGQEHGFAILDIDRAADLLCLANYNGKDLHPAVRFAYDPERIGGAAGQRHSQFAAFMKLCSWMLRRMKSNWIYEPLTPPLHAARTLLVVVGKLGPKFLEEASALSPSQLVNGFGPGVCRLLCVLAEALVFRVQKLRFRDPDYSAAALPSPIEDDDARSTVSDAGPESDAEVSDLVNEDEDAADNEEFAPARTQQLNPSAGLLGGPIVLPRLGNPSRDAAEAWRLEKERVALRLQGDRSGKSRASESWRTRAQELVLQSSRLAAQRSGLVDMLESAATNWTEELGNVRNGEARLGRAFEPARQEYCVVSSQIKALRAHVEELSSVVEALACEAAEIEDQRDDIVSQIARRSETITDPSCTKKLREMLTQLREEVKTMKTKIGVHLCNLEALCAVAAVTTMLEDSSFSSPKERASESI